MNNDEKKYLSEVIDYQKDIAPYQFIQVYSGVGSGKNYWVETLAQQGHNILLITSRKATADAQSKKLDGSRWINLDELSQKNFGPKEQIKVVVTNAGIEKFLKNKYKSEDERTHIWKYFDFIILDEAHSLVADATFSDSPFHVKAFLKWAKRKYPKCKIVLMTGTPEPIEELITDKLKNSSDYNFLNLYSKCKHVDPKNVILEYKLGIEDEIVEGINKGHRLIYFANSITRMEELVKSLISLGVDEQCIGIGYSGDKRRDFPQVILESKEKIRRSLLENELIPKEIKLFITTTQNKEGVNINDTNIKIMISESCQKAELIQMAGRVRNGLDELYILYDAKQHSTKNTETIRELDNCCLKSVKQFWKDKGYNAEENLNIIKMIEDKFPNIRYNYLYNNFCFYIDRERGFRYQTEDRQDLNYFINEWEAKGYDYIHERDMVNGLGWSLFQSWFEWSDVNLIRELPVEKQFLQLDNHLRMFLKKNHYLGQILTCNRKKEFEESLIKFLKEEGFNYKKMGIKFPFKMPNPFLKKFSYKIIEAPGRRKGTAYQIVKIKEE